ncbi:1-aminocyclopropane-1-carboxylate deaminase [Catellatospora sp. IY07-71]|uniref:1-aminocyclopropane-1-carboxylate deaminase/D-cysteine desulfhydrase n=1 Tax=Catellatospora sp. IY07-71 TaxID=2728827 RepID=UPI001BB80715|nr:pyridoxal-phosphate dependent enzyme [Catellatospora sp. IY07-71]BCJ71427.1 1-aminocyclopropane-1-carboxylate deaminase [Catellatospora sp. IY07-71]
MRVDTLRDERIAAAGVTVLLVRDDLVDPELPGNKWRKLKYNLVAAREQGFGTLLTFGGAYSNHLRAVAAAGRRCGLRTIGVVRGEEHLPLNPSLAYAAAQGMALTYLDRETYRRKHTPEVLARLERDWGACYVIPEGGSNALAVKGCAELPGEIGTHFDVICCPVGTGGTLAGLAAGLSSGQRALGIAVLKGAGFLADEVRELLRQALGAPTDNWAVDLDHHYGGYAKRTPGLDAFVADFKLRHGLALDPIYTGKLLAGLYDLIAQDAFPPGTRLAVVVTGTAPLDAPHGGA